MPQNKLQDLCFETDTIEMFSAMLKTCIEITQCNYIHYQNEAGQIGFVTEQYPSFAAAWMMERSGRPAYKILSNHDENNPKHYWWICTLGRTGRINQHSTPQIEFEDSTEAVQCVVDLLQTIDRFNFLGKFQDNPFKGSEGTTTMGYRIVSPAIGSNDLGLGILEVSLCHIYYSK